MRRLAKELRMYSTSPLSPAAVRPERRRPAVTRRPHVSLALAVAGAFAVVVGPARAQDQAAAAPITAPRPPAVTIEAVTEHELLRTVPVAGTLVPREEVLVYPQTSGHAIQELLADVGDRVEQDDVLARLNARTLRAQLAEAEAEHARAEAGVRQAESQISSSEATLQQAEQALGRAQRLRSSGTTTQSALDEALAAQRTAKAAVDSAIGGLAVAKAQLQQAEAGHAIARLNFENAELRAPVGGIISERNGQIGAIASASGEPIFRIIRSGEVEVAADVLETELGLVSPGDPAELTVAGIGPVQGTVRLVLPVVEAASRLGTVRIALEPRDGLRPGLFAGGRIVADRLRSLTVPGTAVLSDNEEDFVLLVESGRLERRPVLAGLLWEGRRQILRGLEPGDDVVARAGAFYGDGDAIRPVRAEPAEARQ